MVVAAPLDIERPSQRLQTSLTAPSAFLAARSLLRAPCVSSLRRQWLEPELYLPGVRPNQLEKWWAPAASPRSIWAMWASSGGLAVCRIRSGTAGRGSAGRRTIVCSPVRVPCGMVVPNHRQKPRETLMREFRVPLQSERLRSRPFEACCSTDFTRQRRMPEPRRLRAERPHRWRR